jgi:hypothetical protein
MSAVIGDIGAITWMYNMSISCCDSGQPRTAETGLKFPMHVTNRDLEQYVG